MPLLRKLFVLTATLTYQVSAFSPSSSLPPNLRHGILSSPVLSRPLPPPTTTTTTSQHAPPSRSSSLARRIPTNLHGSESDDNDEFLVLENNEENSCWNPNLRKHLAFVSSLGVAETAYLTYDKIQYTSSGGKTSSSLVAALCSAADNGASSCGDILHGPYASLHLGGLDVPLSSLGMAAYTTVFLLAALPLLGSEKNAQNDGVLAVMDGNNRVALLGGTTLMASFSVYLVSLLLGVLHASCVFCFVSAGLSFSMAALSWGGGMLPNIAEGVESSSSEEKSQAMEFRKRGMAAGASSVGLATVAALGLFLGVSDGSDGNFDSLAASSIGASTTAPSGTLLASTGTAKSYAENVPPRITTKSSPAALALASDLNSLDARMFGAFWCSHCYDQKQALGKEAMQTVPYIECDREGYNNQRDVCKEREVPGYPTWEIGGKLFPGEKSVEELREVVDDVKSGK
eukprot:CAMPEP_0196132312 /NCGR_PEP_ID=MMETSP0910-20130528/1993_1 /TAXON_ID=49265 /ORGANISM="Thalassiosira rotula, Strain GSO102" /LENGTH=457 /DNA_ID=CAMNT_0041391911 /DNA_START=26 /DNA_END=1399 /DNA_ORIENTATION=-